MDTALRIGTGIRGARDSIITGVGALSNAGSSVARIHSRAVISIITGIGIVDVLATEHGIATVRGTGIVIITTHAVARIANAPLTVIPSAAGVPIIAGHCGQVGVLATRVGITSVRRTRIVIVATLDGSRHTQTIGTIVSQGAGIPIITRCN